MGAFVAAAKNTMLDGLTVTYMSLHTGDPSTTGANEVTGGSPAYARKACTFNAASSGSRALNADVTFDVPACTVAYVGYWSAVDGTFLGSDQVTSEVFAAQGQYIVTASGTTLSLTD
jgi:hypothetical protein